MFLTDLILLLNPLSVRGKKITGIDVFDLF